VSDFRETEIRARTGVSITLVDTSYYQQTS
jgi:hypothetical protein